MASLKGSQTEKNLLTAFAGESQARNRYTYFAGAARKEGMMQISDVFTETANQEKEHAKRYFKFLEGGEVEIQWPFPAGVIGTIAENLEAAAGGEHYEWTEMYPKMADAAESEGFKPVAAAYRAIMVAEKRHEERYLELLEHVRNGTVFARKEKTVWRCRNCGYLHEGTEAPGVCPACLHPQAHFEELEGLL